MQDFGLVSIITPTFNCADFIVDTLNSILSQTYQNWELLITDDCSTDNSREIIQNYCARDERIKLFKLPHNSGAGIARNNSISHAKGRFIAFCDSDDRWYPDKLKKQIMFMVTRNYAFSYTSYMTCNDAGDNIGIVVAPLKVTYSSILRDDKIGCLTAIYDISKVGKIYMPELRKRQDWALKIRVLAKCQEAYGLKEPLAIYRVRSNSLSSRKIELAKYNLAVYRQVLAWNPIHSYIFFSLVFIPSYFFKRLITSYINR